MSLNVLMVRNKAASRRTSATVLSRGACCITIRAHTGVVVVDEEKNSCRLKESFSVKKFVSIE